MHELSIAISIIELAEEEAGRRGNAQVNAIHLKLGLLSGVAKEALLSSYDLACEGTALEGSRLIIEDMPIVVYCPKCDRQREANTLSSTAQWFNCPECGTLTPEILHGRELQVAAMEIEE